MLNPISTRGGGQICPPLLVKNILSPLSHKRIFPDFLTFPKYVLGTTWIIKKMMKKNFLRGAEKILHWGGRSAPPPGTSVRIFMPGTIRVNYVDCPLSVACSVI